MKTEIVALPIHIENIPEELRYVEYGGKWGGVSKLPPCYSSGGVQLVHFWGILESPSGHASADAVARRSLEEILTTTIVCGQAEEAMRSHLEEWDRLYNQEDED